MATKKTVKKAESQDLPLAEQLKVKKADLLMAQKSLHANTLQNPHSIRVIKKDIARILTAINQQDTQMIDTDDNNNKEKGA